MVSLLGIPYFSRLSLVTVPTVLPSFVCDTCRCVLEGKFVRHRTSCFPGNINALVLLMSIAIKYYVQS